MKDGRKYSNDVRRPGLKEGATGRLPGVQETGDLESLGVEGVEELEGLGIEDLERAAQDGSVRIPEDLRDELAGLVDGLAAVERISAPDFALEEASRGGGTDIRFRRVPGFFRGGSVRLWIAGMAAAVALAAVLGGEAYRNRTPKDTFDDPMEALAFMQETFSGVGERIGKGLRCLDSTREAASSNLEIFKSEQNKD